MIHTPAAVAVPLRSDEHGVIRIGESRVTLVTIVRHYKLGDSIPTIHEGFPTVKLSDLYAVIAYYLANQETLDAYIHQIDKDAEQVRHEWESHYTPEQMRRTEQLKQKIEDHKNVQDV